MGQKFKPLIFLGIDFTPRKSYRAEISRLEYMNDVLQNSFAKGEKDRNDLLKKCAVERNKRYACETELAKYKQKRGANGKFVKR